mmetsp:Transcript_76948/g.160109  ORF Transcript_76948/g.160109 Transcript_76948/m.160109 type:complete len:241 (-) Transcript_76948:1017-1739(-)
MSQRPCGGKSKFLEIRLVFTVLTTEAPEGQLRGPFSPGHLDVQLQQLLQCVGCRPAEAWVVTRTPKTTAVSGTMRVVVVVVAVGMVVAWSMLRLAVTRNSSCQLLHEEVAEGSGSLLPLSQVVSLLQHIPGGLQDVDGWTAGTSHLAAVVAFRILLADFLEGLQLFLHHRQFCHRDALLLKSIEDRSNITLSRKAIHFEQLWKGQEALFDRKVGHLFYSTRFRFGQPIQGLKLLIDHVGM